MPSLKLNSATRTRIDHYRDSMPHALLLSGPAGSGLATLAHDMAGDSHAGTLTPIDKDGAPDPQKGSIQVSQIRELYQHASAKASHRRVFIIDDAHRMTHGAQNAFLKLLEEPNEHTCFILTSHDDTKLLPTVRSRVQHLDVGRISDADSVALLAEHQITDPRISQQMLFLARGLPAELTRLATSTELFDANARIVSDAKKLIQGTPYERLVVVSAYGKERPDALKLLEYALTIITFSMKQHVTPELIQKADTLTTAYDRIVANGNIRLQLAAAVA